MASSGRRKAKQYSVAKNFVSFDMCDYCFQTDKGYSKQPGCVYDNQFLASYQCGNEQCGMHDLSISVHICCLNKHVCDLSTTTNFKKLQHKGVEGRILPGSRKEYNKYLRCETCNALVKNLYFAKLQEYEQHLLKTESGLASPTNGAVVQPGSEVTPLLNPPPQLETEALESPIEIDDTGDDEDFFNECLYKVTAGKQGYIRVKYMANVWDTPEWFKSL